VPRSATITAATDAVIYEITQASMAELLQSRPEVMEKLSLMMAERRLRNEQTKDRQSGLPDEEATASLASQLFASMKGVFGRIWSQKG
jgi:CRP-like cAMP-binding protein